MKETNCAGCRCKVYEASEYRSGTCCDTTQKGLTTPPWSISFSKDGCAVAFGPEPKP